MSNRFHLFRVLNFIMGLFGNKRKKSDKYCSNKGVRSGYEPLSIAATSPSAYFDVYGQVVSQGKYGQQCVADINQQQPMFVPSYWQMQPYIQGQIGAILPPMQMSSSFAQQNGFVPGQFYPYLSYPPTSYFDANCGLFQQQQQGAFAPYQQANIYDSAWADLYASPYGYMPTPF